MASIRALQLGGEDCSQRFELTADVSWSFEPELAEADREYDVALVGRPLSVREASWLERHVRAHCLLVADDLPLDGPMDHLVRSRRARLVSRADVPGFIERGLRNYFSKPYGEKFAPNTLTVSPGFRGAVGWNGGTELVLEGSFGEGMRQAAFWRGNLPLEPGQALDLWLEYEKDGDVEVQLEVVRFARGSISSVRDVLTFSEDDLAEPVTVDNDGDALSLFVSLNARGEGALRIRALHDRHSRRGAGAFLPGGRRWVTPGREELFTYFDPGDLRPPLCVYFSGYKTMEGFEGYYMMRRMGCPFLLVTDARLEGGDFYLGGADYESLVLSAIREACQGLGISERDVVLSGLSMGTFAALYYATMVPCANVIVGKPLLSLGNVAANERLKRPAVFPTSLDVLWKECGSLDGDAVARLNRRFWDRFDETDWSGRTIFAAYMIEDDYDEDAYPRLLSHVRGAGARVVGKGLHGRHNDDTAGVVAWFKAQYRRVLREYGRGGGPDGAAG